MKKVIKRFVRFVNEDCLKFYLKIYYRWQLKHKLLKSSDSIDKGYKNNIKKYWSKFNIKVSTDWHKWYSSRNGIEDERYIPEDVFYSTIEPFYNRVDFSQAYADKALHSMWFPDVKRPLTISKNVSGINYDDEFKPITLEEVLIRCENKKRIIIKPTIESGGGRDICFIDAKDKNDMKRKVMYAISEFKQDYIIQEIIEQHEFLKRINPESVNTIRIISFYFKGKVYILSSILRMGVDGARVDNETSGGISCGIKEDGRLRRYAFDKFGTSLEIHPQGFIFENSIVPSYSNVIDIIKREHARLGHFRIISWDYAIDNHNDPILIEYNLRFQGLNFHQLNNGALFGELTDEVLQEVFGRKYRQ